MDSESIIYFINDYPFVIFFLAIAVAIAVGLLTLLYTEQCADFFVKLLDIALSPQKSPPPSKESPSLIIFRYSVARAIILSLKWFIGHILVKILPHSYTFLLRNRIINDLLTILPWYRVLQEKAMQLEEEMTDQLANSLTYSQEELNEPDSKQVHLKKLELYQLYHTLEKVAFRFRQTQNREDLREYQTIFSKCQALYNEILHQTEIDFNGAIWRKYREQLEYHRRFLNQSFIPS